MFLNPCFFIANGFSKTLGANALIQQAERSAGLSDWGGLQFREPFERLIDALNNEADLSHQGRFVLRHHYHRLLRNLLKLVEDWKKNPQIRKVDIGDPIFIVGCPRTGTTFLHGLLAQDPANRALRYWELLFPSPPPSPETDDGDPRISKAKWFTRGIDFLSPKLARIHQLEATAPEECCFMFDHFFLDSIHHLVFDIPSYIEWHDNHDPIPSYQFHCQLLRHYGLNFKFERFALKAPRHLYCLDALMRVYPTAKIIWTHRDPCEAVPSLCSLVETSRRIVLNHIDRERIGQLCLEHFAKDLRAGTAALEKINPNQILHVAYKELVHDPKKTMQMIYGHFDIGMSGKFAERMDAHLQKEHQRKRKPHQYCAEQYGLSHANIQDRLLWHCGRFQSYL